jgi:hypothetical protein
MTEIDYYALLGVLALPILAAVLWYKWVRR